MPLFNNIVYIVIVILLIIFIIYIVLENHMLKKEFYVVKYSKLPQNFDNCKIILITDLHNNKFGKNNKNLLKKIDDELPDFIMIAGDLMVGNDNPNMSISLNLLEQLSKKYNIFYVNGNHESKIKNMENSDIYKKYERKIKDMGINYINNENVHIVRTKNGKREEIIVTGLELDREFFGKFHRPPMTVEYINNILGESKKDKFNILIAHNPMYFEEYAKWGADLVLSGHIHGGIMILPYFGGILSPQMVLFPKYDRGKFKYNKSTLILSRGLGLHTIKLRIFNRPELSVIKLLSK